MDDEQNKQFSGDEGEANEEIPEEVYEVLDNNEIPEDEKKKLASIFVKQTSYSGPLPPPDLIKKFDEVVENGAERVFKQFENQSNHRREIEKSVIGSQIKRSRYGQLFGFIVAIVCIIIGTYAAFNGFEAFGSTIAGSTVVGLVYAFGVHRKTMNKDLREKDPK